MAQGAGVEVGDGNGGRSTCAMGVNETVGGLGWASVWRFCDRDVLWLLSVLLALAFCFRSICMDTSFFVACFCAFLLLFESDVYVTVILIDLQRPWLRIVFCPALSVHGAEAVPRLRSWRLFKQLSARLGFQRAGCSTQCEGFDEHCGQRQTNRQTDERQLQTFHATIMGTNCIGGVCLNISWLFYFCVAFV